MHFNTEITKGIQHKEAQRNTEKSMCILHSPLCAFTSVTSVLKEAAP